MPNFLFFLFPLGPPYPVGIGPGCAIVPFVMTTRHRTISSSRNDLYWRPSDSDSDHPRQTMATQRNVDHTVAREALRKRHNSRRVDLADPLDPAATYSRQHHKSSKDRSSVAPQPSYYVVPSPNTSIQHQTQYDLRAYIRKSSKRSPRSSNDRALAGDEVKASRSGHHSRHAQPTTATHPQVLASTQIYHISSSQAIRDPTSSSRHHRSRDKEREKTRSRNPEKVKTQDPTTDKSEDRERRHRRDKEGERSSKDKERHKEKDRHKDRPSRTAGETQPADTAGMYQAYIQNAGAAQRSTDKISVQYPESTRAPLAQTQAARVVAAPSVGMPWAGLTASGRGVAGPAYPAASDKDDPPLPIPPPERRRERTSSKPHRSHHQLPSQQAGQDSGISSSEQEHSVMERTRKADRHHVSREQGSLLQRGHSSGPSGSENEKAPTVQKERLKHRAASESSRHKSKSASADVLTPAGPTRSQEIASAWYQRRDSSLTKYPAPSVDPPSQKLSNGASAPAQASVPPPGKTTSSVGLTASQRFQPQIVSIRAGQGPADPHTNTMLPKIHSGVTPIRQPEPLPAQQYQLAARPQDVLLQAQSQTVADYGDMPPSHRSPGPLQHSRPTLNYPNTLPQPRHSDSNGLGLSTTHAHGAYRNTPEVVLRPPAVMDPHSSRAASTQPSPSGGQSSGRLHAEARSRSAAGSGSKPAGFSHATGQPPTQSLVAQYGDEESSRWIGAGHTKVPSHDLSSRFPVYDDTAAGAARTLASGYSASPKRGSTYPGASAPPSATVYGNSSSNNYDQWATKTPSIKTMTPDSYTPKRSPSARLHSQRNGSNDTISHTAPTKQSPSGSAQQHLPHALLRPETTTTSHQPSTSSAYPEEIGYRSPSLTRYPNANNVMTNNHSQVPNTTVPYDYQQGRNAVPTQSTYAPQHGQAYAPQQGRAGHVVDYGLRSPEPAKATFPPSIPAYASTQRVPRSAPSPTPTVRPTRLELLSSPSATPKTPVSVAPQTTRNQTYSASASKHITNTPFPTTHWRTASDPQYAKVGSGYASGSLSTRGQAPHRNGPALASQNDLLLTPSSLAPSNLPPHAPAAPLTRTESKTSSKEGKKKGFFGLNIFRSRSSPPKQREFDALPSVAVREKRVSQPTQPSPYMQASNVAAKGFNGPSASQVNMTAMAGPQAAIGQSRGANPIVAPTPTAPGSGQNNGKIFTPFRLLSRWHHTVSTASVEAVDGTVINAMLTGGDSTRSSTAGRPSPPLRDAMTAAQEWRNNEEQEHQGRGTVRRRRPGVTFDIGDEVPEDGRPPVQKSMRANLQSYQTSPALRASA